MAESINIQSNRKEIEIQRDGEIVGSIYFDPTDPSLIDRLLQAKQALDEYKPTAPSKDEPIDSIMAKLKEADGKLRAAVDFAFDYPCSDIVFGNEFAISTRAGVSKFEQFLDGAMKIIERSMTAEVKAAKKRQDKYLAKYRA